MVACVGVFLVSGIKLVVCDLCSFVALVSGIKMVACVGVFLVSGIKLVVLGDVVGGRILDP